MLWRGPRVWCNACVKRPQSLRIHSRLNVIQSCFCFQVLPGGMPAHMCLLYPQTPPDRLSPYRHHRASQTFFSLVTPYSSRVHCIQTPPTAAVRGHACTHSERHQTDRIGSPQHMQIESAALCKMHRHLHWWTTSSQTCSSLSARQLASSFVIQSIYQYFHPSNTKFPAPDVLFREQFFLIIDIRKWSADLEMFHHPIFYISIYLESCCGDSFVFLFFCVCVFFSTNLWQLFSSRKMGGTTKTRS